MLIRRVSINDGGNNGRISLEYRVSRTSFMGLWKDTVEIRVILESWMYWESLHWLYSIENTRELEATSGNSWHYDQVLPLAPISPLLIDRFALGRCPDHQTWRLQKWGLLWLALHLTTGDAVFYFSYARPPHCHWCLCTSTAPEGHKGPQVWPQATHVSKEVNSGMEHYKNDFLLVPGVHL